MSKFNTLIGLSVKVFLDSHTVEGVLETVDSEKIILNAEGSYVLIYKNKVNMVILNWNESIEEPSVPEVPKGYHESEPEESEPEESEPEESEPEELESEESGPEESEPEAVEPPDLFAQNGIAENNQYGSIRPGILLEQQPMDPMERLIDAGLIITEEEFSINAGTLYNEDGLLDRAERQKIMEETKKEVKDGSQE